MNIRQLNKRHQQRWDSVKHLFEHIIQMAKWHNAMVMFDGQLIDVSQIHIVDDTIFVQIENCRFIQFQANPDYDHGLYDTTTEIARTVRKKFKLVKPLEY